MLSKILQNSENFFEKILNLYLEKLDTMNMAWCSVIQKVMITYQPGLLQVIRIKLKKWLWKMAQAKIQMPFLGKMKYDLCQTK